jgi:tetratricopeptide (TPR) repeat protein/tRNA A-37 threonylcarbamoyl transferase component Bud32/TolB-like protein
MADIFNRLQATLSGTYVLERELGGGGMSKVFLADELRLGRKVVVKVLSPELAAGISAERFEREIRLAASLQQANIVPLLSTGDTDGLPFYTMPFVEGESLRARLAHQPGLQVLDVVRILGDVARALQYAHERGVVHRDIKPDNVLLSGGTAVVTDFGIAKALSASRTAGAGATLTQLGTSMGTPAYMAPEQAVGDPDTDARADIYALGCMAYELLAGHPPFHDRTPQRVLAAQLSEAPKPISSLRPDAPAALCDLVMRCLAKDADDRPQTAAEVIVALNVATSGWGVPTLPPVLLQGPGAFRRALIGYAIAVVMVAIVTRAATITIGLPDWVMPGALAVMALGLPVILFTGYVQRVTRRSLTATPAITAGGGHSVQQGTMATIALKASPHVSWQRTTRSGVYALGVFAALVVGYMVMRAFGIGPVGSLLAEGRLSQRDPILVADFTTSHTDSSVGRVVAEGVRQNLSQSSSITLFSPTSVSAALTRMQLPVTTPLTPTVARQLASREGIKAIVSGDVTGLGNGFVIALRLVSADSGDVLASYQTTVDGPSQLVSGVDEVTRKLRGKIGESLKTVQDSPPLEQVTTASYEALKAYTEGTRSFDTQDFQKAIPHLRQAVAIDTGFAMAWRKLAMAYQNGGYPPSTINSAMSKAFQMRSRLTDKERYMTEGTYYGSGINMNRSRSIAAYQALIATGDSVDGENNLGVEYMALRKLPQAETAFRASARLSSGMALVRTNLAFALVMQGKNAAADSVLAAALPKFPSSPGVLSGVVLTRYATGDMPGAERIADSVDRTTTNAGMRQTMRQLRVYFAVLHGRVTEANRLYDQLTAMQRDAGLATTPALTDSIAFAMADWWFLGNRDRALKRLDAAVAALPMTNISATDRPYGNLGASYAVLGRTDRARAVLAQIAQISDTAQRVSHASDVHWIKGEIALAENRGLEAVAEFERADSLPDGPAGEDPSYVLFQTGRAYDGANQPDSAISRYEQYLHTPSIDRIADDLSALPMVQRRLGELYQARGDRARAIAHYTAFADLWKNADAELQPQVAAARKQIALLSAK